MTRILQVHYRAMSLYCLQCSSVGLSILQISDFDAFLDVTCRNKYLIPSLKILNVSFGKGPQGNITPGSKASEKLGAERPGSDTGYFVQIFKCFTLTMILAAEITVWGKWHFFFLTCCSFQYFSLQQLKADCVDSVLYSTMLKRGRIQKNHKLEWYHQWLPWGLLSTFLCYH